MRELELIVDLKATIIRAKILELKKEYMQDKEKWEDVYCDVCNKKIADKGFVYFVEINRFTFGYCSKCVVELTNKNITGMFRKLKGKVE